MRLNFVRKGEDGGWSMGLTVGIGNSEMKTEGGVQIQARCGLVNKGMGKGSVRSKL